MIYVQKITNSALWLDHMIPFSFKPLTLNTALRMRVQKAIYLKWSPLQYSSLQTLPGLDDPHFNLLVWVNRFPPTTWHLYLISCYNFHQNICKADEKRHEHRRSSHSYPSVPRRKIWWTLFYFYFSLWLLTFYRHKFSPPRANHSF